MVVDLTKPIAIFDWNEKATSQDAADQVFVGPPVDRDRILMTTHCAIVNATHQGTKLILGKRDAAGRDHYFKVAESNVTFHLSIAGHVMMEEGERPLGKIEGAADGDTLYCTFHGHIYKT